MTMNLLGIGSAWSRLSGRFAQHVSTIVVSASLPVDKPRLTLSKDIFRPLRIIFEYCPFEISQTLRPNLATIIDAKPLETRLKLISILAVRIAVIYSSFTRDTVISTLYIAVFARFSGITRHILKSRLWLIQKAAMRTERRKSNQYSQRTNKMEGRCCPYLPISSPRTGKSQISSQTNWCQKAMPRLNLKPRMIPLFLSFSTLVKVSKAGPITFRDEAVACQFTTGDPFNDCPIGTSTSLTPGAQALIASCVLAALLVFLIVVFGLPQALKDMALVIWIARLPGFNREAFRWHSGRHHERFDGRVGRNSTTVEATEGNAGSEMLASENPKVQVHWKKPLSWFWIFRMPQILRPEGQDQGDGQIFTPGIPDERDKVILRMGAVFDSATMERPFELHNLDLFHSSQDQGHELEELPAARLGPSDHQDQS